jgi:hypothetical protein
MSVTMSRSVSLRPPDLARAAAEIADDVVTAVRNRGFTRRQAVDVAAAELDTSPRRVRALLWGEPIRVFRAEYDRLCDRFAAHLEAEAQRHDKRAAALRERLRSMAAER